MLDTQTVPSRSTVERATRLLLSTNPDRTAGLRSAIAMSRIHAYLRAAHQLVLMIAKFKAKATPPRPSYSANMIQAFIYAHLYFICWAAIGRMIDLIRRGSRLEAPNTVYKRYRMILESYANARDHFEHYEERLPGGGKSPELLNPADYGNLQGGSFSVGGYRWDVTEASLKKLETIVADLSAKICEEGLEKTKKRLAAK